MPGSGTAAVAVSAYGMPAGQEGLVAMFMQQARKSAAEVRRADSRQALENDLAELLAWMPLATADIQLADDYPMLVSVADDTDPRCRLVRAESGIAETGSICLAGSRHTTRELFLCEHLVVLLRVDDILYCQEDYWRQQVSTAPQSLHLVSGPSRTADVEQTLQIGAHGPRGMTILLADANAASGRKS